MFVIMAMMMVMMIMVLDGDDGGGIDGNLAIVWSWEW